jgi:transcriptional regulator CtsR
MSNLADRIEEYLKKILGQTEEGYIVLQEAFWQIPFPVLLPRLITS